MVRTTYTVMKNTLILLLLLLAGQVIYARNNFERKQVSALRIDDKIKVDGVLDEPIWNKAYLATDFRTFEPQIGLKASQKSEVKILYDNSSLYIGALLYNDNASQIKRGLSKRDERTVNADIFWITISPYNDGQNYFAFKVSAANVQSDIKISSDSHDRNWDAVWYSEVKITDKGWLVEMQIPYDAIRFPKRSVQTWGVNFWRFMAENKEVSSWNAVDKSIGSWVGQAGKLNGIRDIDAPFRLSLYPYVSSYVQHNGDDQKPDLFLNGGLDLKYGINESFTLDMTLVPDFGQTFSDNRELNLSSYETKYDENRQFFTEGTELFNKAGLFYSRRIGGLPQKYYDVDAELQEGESIAENPLESGLINATKISGRTKQGMGIGFFNAMTRKTEATIVDDEGNSRKITTQPFTNYNILVVDKTLGKYSFINLINTNVYKATSRDRDDVLGTAFKFADANNEFALQGNAAHSIKYDPITQQTVRGEYIDVSGGKINGNLYYSYHFKLLTDKYDHNDMGYLDRNNRMVYGVKMGYRIFEPFWKLLNMSFDLDVFNTMQYAPRRFSERLIRFSSTGTLTNHLTLGGRVILRPGEHYDYNEPRESGYRFARPSQKILYLWASTDYRKTLALDAELGLMKLNGEGRTKEFENTSLWGEVCPLFRLNDKVFLSHKLQYTHNENSIGYVESPAVDSVVFGCRDIEKITNTISGSYIFSNKSALSLKMRHYWSKVEYEEFYDLEPDGYLFSHPDYSNNADLNYNAFNVDLTYSWNFAPGSFMNIMWKNSIYSEDSVIVHDFMNNLDQLFKTAQTNSLSVKVSYYLDYKKLRKGILL